MVLQIDGLLWVSGKTLLGTFGSHVVMSQDYSRKDPPMGREVLLAVRDCSRYTALYYWNGPGRIILGCIVVGQDPR